MNTELYLPYVCLRALVLFPEQSIDLAVGRPESKQALQASNRHYDNRLVVVTQRDADQGSPRDFADLYQVGTICSIEALVELDDLLRVHVTGRSIVDLQTLSCDDQVPLAQVSLRLTPPYVVADWQKEREEVVTALSALPLPTQFPPVPSLSALAAEDSVALFIAGSLNLLRSACQVGSDGTKRVLKPLPADTELRRRLNQIISEQQRILELPEPLNQLTEIKKLIQQQKTAG